MFFDSYSFPRDPLDVALRRLLMDIHLPKETQQIDRVMEAFARRYMSCNSDLFSSSGTWLRGELRKSADALSRSAIYSGF